MDIKEIEEVPSTLFHDEPTLKLTNFRCDQNGVVFFDTPPGCMGKDTYIKYQMGHPFLPLYENLPFWDSHEQSWIDVD